MATTNSTDLGGQIEKKVSGVLSTTLIQESVSIGSVDDRSSEVGPGMDRLDIALMNELAIQDVSESSDVTPQSITPSEFQLELNTSSRPRQAWPCHSKACSGMLSSVFIRVHLWFKVIIK